MGFLTARPTLALILTLVGSFLVSFAAMWRAQSPRVAAESPPPTLIAARDLAPSSPPMARPPVENWGPSVRPTPVASRPPTPAPTPAAKAAAEEAGSAGPMPIGLNLYNRRNRHRFEGYVSNASTVPLSGSLEVVDAAGHIKSTLRFNLTPGGRQDFSSDAGVDMQTNDLVVVHCDAYPDLSMAVP